MNKLIVFFLLLTNSCFAVKEYYSLTRSIRALGMGGAFYGLSDDQHALFYNPAGLDLYRGNASWMTSIPFVTAQVSPQLISAISTFTHLKGASVNTIIDDISSYRGDALYAEDTPLFTYYVRKHFAVALLVADTKADVVLTGADLSTSVDVTAISDTGLLFGYSGTLFPGLHLGANTKVVYRVGGEQNFSLVDIQQGNEFKVDPSSIGGRGLGIDFDLGAIYDLPYSPGLVSRVALVFNDLVGTSFPIARKSQAPPALPRMVSLGTSTIFKGIGPIDNFNVVLDLAEFGLGGGTPPNLGERSGSFWKHVNLGVELPMQWFSFRAGIHQGNLTAGLGVRSGGFELVAATYAEELMSGVGRLTSRRYAVQMKVGLGNAPPPPLTRDNVATPEKVKQPDADENTSSNVENGAKAASAPAGEVQREEIKSEETKAQEAQSAEPEDTNEEDEPQMKETDSTKPAGGDASQGEGTSLPNEETPKTP